MRISDWSSDVCSSDLLDAQHGGQAKTVQCCVALEIEAGALGEAFDRLAVELGMQRAQQAGTVGILRGEAVGGGVELSQLGRPLRIRLGEHACAAADIASVEVGHPVRCVLRPESERWLLVFFPPGHCE